jgi:hypothetical protein
VKKKTVVISEYNTRRRACGQHVNTLEERPPKPEVPRKKACVCDPGWIAADLRESGKLNSEDTFLPLPLDINGKPVWPEGAIALHLLRKREYKWKEDPETGELCWLKCCRFVVDGSMDKRSDVYYAECPDRIVLFLLVSLGASIGEASNQSDCVRAYLNALSIDRNIVIIAAPDMQGVPRESLLNKGLYGSRAGALSWERWINDKMDGLGYQKADVARSVYLKKLESGELLRALRHSDDFRLSSKDAEGMTAEEAKMRSSIRMSDFSICERFLGCTFERINLRGELDPDGEIVLVRQREKIAEMNERFKSWREVMNPRSLRRKSPLPATALKEDCELDVEDAILLTGHPLKDYQSLVGCVGWIAGSTRPECKFGYFVLSIRVASPRMFDMFLAVYVMDYLVATADAPLVLGGPECDPEVYADASYALLKERRSIVGHMVTTGPKSGAIYAHVGATKCAVTSIFEAELIAGCEGVNTAVYVTQLCEELQYPVGKCRKVFVDNEAEVAWVRGSVSNKRSRHVDVKLYHSRHMHEEGRVCVTHIAGEDNPADILTKPLTGEVFIKHATTILGHELIRGLGVRGAFC